MRGRSSSAKSRLRSAGYKCNLCGRKVVDAAALEKHQKTNHNVSTRSNRVFKPKPTAPKSKLSSKEKEKAFDDLKNEIQSESKTNPRTNKNDKTLRSAALKDPHERKEIISKNTVDVPKNGKTVVVEKDMKQIKEKDNARKAEFECPVCKMLFSVYLTAHKHIQKFHPVDANGKKVAPNSMEMVQPIRVEQCYRCNSKIRSNENHICSKIVEEVEDSRSLDYVCTGCNQSFVSLKTFDVHVAGLHSEGVDSMFFPTKIEYTNWRLEMEWQTNAKFSIMGEYDSKKVYRCNYAHEDLLKEKTVCYVCPSSLVVQDFSKGIQVHFYNKHHGHLTKDYTLSSKYNKYSITSFLKNPVEDSSIRRTSLSKKQDNEDLYTQFKKLMDGIVLNATHVGNTTLALLIERALDMSALITDSEIVIDTLTKNKTVENISDKAITEELEVKAALSKRRRSVDTYDTPPPNPAKRTRNKSLYVQTSDNISPKIINTYSLATNCNSDDNGSNFDMDSVKSDSNEKTETINNTSTPKPIRNIKRPATFTESPSFNDSYKDFIDRNFIGRSDKIRNTRSSRSTVKTKLGEFTQMSPKKVDCDEVSKDIAVKNIGGVKSISVGNTTIEDTNTPKVINPNVKILSVENPNMTISKVKTISTPNRKVTSQVITPKVDTPKVTNKAAFSHLVDPLQLQITKVTKSSSSPTIVSRKENITRVSTRSVSSVAVDPLELNIDKADIKSTPSTLKTYKTPSKVNKPQVDTSKLNVTKIEGSKVYPGKVKSKPIGSPVVKDVPKATTKVTVDEATTTNKYTGIIKQKKIKDLQYEVREQENDCNILVLKL